ncbi:TIGR01244 family sulfur transferase [Neisseria sp.]|uniref:TIGR01244 family sulfur transferase n=1 Tax=Neisseria sp. TaxID=192066 RepID=UPI0028A069E8|nr:TIGR01244 family sulfur transferase [Neisseria sp.]
MAISRLSEKLYISPQVSPADAAEAAKLGIRSVICNRPDGEEPGQPSAEQAAAWFAEAGITSFHHQPVLAPQINADDARRFAKQLAAVDGPVLAYCRTGTRSSLLWAIGQAENGGQANELIAEIQQKTGVDLSPFAGKLLP